MAETIDNYFYIHNVIGSFFKSSLDYFSDYLYPRFKWKVMGTYDKAVEYLNKKSQYGREVDEPNLPAIILNPTGEVRLADLNAGGKQLFRFPNISPGLVKYLYDPIYQDQNILVNAAFLRLAGQFELIILPSSYYELLDLNVYAMLLSGGSERYFYPVVFDTFIIIPDSMINYEYYNDETGLRYKLDWYSVGASTELVRTTNRNELVLPCTIRPIYKVSSINDGSEKYGGTDKLAEWRLVATVDFEIEIPSYIVITTDYIASNFSTTFGFGSCYSKNSTQPEDVRYIQKYTIDSGLDATSNSTPDMQYPVLQSRRRAEFKTRYYHILTHSEIDSTSDLSISIPEPILDTDLLIINSPIGILEYGEDYYVSTDGLTLYLKLAILAEFDVGDYIELYVYVYKE